MKNYGSISTIKNEVEENIGKKVIVKADKGRKKIVTKEGYIENAFPSLFTVRVQNEFDEERTVSYTYSDILTSTVKLQIC